MFPFIISLSVANDHISYLPFQLGPPQSNAIGTFNILNGEDRMVAVAVILPELQEDVNGDD